MNLAQPRIAAAALGVISCEPAPAGLPIIDAFLTGRLPNLVTPTAVDPAQPESTGASLRTGRRFALDSPSEPSVAIANISRRSRQPQAILQHGGRFLGSHPAHVYIPHAHAGIDAVGVVPHKRQHRAEQEAGKSEQGEA